MKLTWGPWSSSSWEDEQRRGRDSLAGDKRHEVDSTAVALAEQGAKQPVGPSTESSLAQTSRTAKRKFLALMSAAPFRPF